MASTRRIHTRWSTRALAALALMSGPALLAACTDLAPDDDALTDSGAEDGATASPSGAAEDARGVDVFSGPEGAVDTDATSAEDVYAAPDGTTSDSATDAERDAEDAGISPTRDCGPKDAAPEDPEDADFPEDAWVPSDAGTDASSDADLDSGVIDDGGPSTDGGTDAVSFAPTVTWDGSTPYLTGPDRGWARESVHLVTWPEPSPSSGVPSGGFGALDVDYSLDEGVTWLPVPPDQYDPLARTLMFVVPAQGGTTVRIRATEAGESTVTVSHPMIPSQKRNYRWTKLTQNAAFGPRDGMGGIVYHGKLYAIGGWNPILHPATATMNDVWSSTDGRTWVREKANTFTNAATFNYNTDWAGRHFAGYTVHDDKMFIVGGDTIQGEYQNDVWSSTNGRVWTKVTQDFGLGPARTFPHIAEFQGKIWAMGGQSFTDFGSQIIPANVYDDVWSSPNGIAWTKTIPQTGLWKPRGLIGNHAVHLGRMWIVAGGIYDDPAFPRGRTYVDTWSTSDGASWVKENEDPPFPARYYHSIAEFDGRLWVLGGFNDYGNLADNWYTYDGSNWYPSTDPNIVARHAGTVWVKDATTMFWGSGNAMDVDGDTETWIADMWKIEVVP
jgi:hypothetical protein